MYLLVLVLQHVYIHVYVCVYCVYTYVAMELYSFTAGLLAGMWEFPLFPATGEDNQEKYLKRCFSEIGIALKDSTPMEYVGEVCGCVCACVHVWIHDCLHSCLSFSH